MNRFSRSNLCRRRALLSLAVILCANSPTLLLAQTVGAWTNVTPAGVDLSSDYGVQDILADPARPSDLYAFICYSGCWKSTDYGLTWKKISVNLDVGRPWGEAIDKNPNRNPSTPPRLYACQGYPRNASAGTWVSVDGGVNWTQHPFPADNQDAYNYDTDPADALHCIGAAHNNNHAYESKDGGMTWVDKGAMAGGGAAVTGSPYLWFITPDIWLAVSQWEGDQGTLRTTDRGATWSPVCSARHLHGNHQIWIDPQTRYIYLPSAGANDHIFRSTDSGATWMSIATSGSAAIIGTQQHIYSQCAWANSGGSNPTLMKADRTPGTSWAAQTDPGMQNGAKRMAAAFNGNNWVIVSGNWNGGIWRYVEAPTSTIVKLPSATNVHNPIAIVKMQLLQGRHGVRSILISSANGLFNVNGQNIHIK